MSQKQFDYQHSLAIIIGVQSYDKLYTSKGKRMFAEIEQAKQNVEVMESGLNNLGFDEIKTFWEPEYKEIQLYFDMLNGTMEERASKDEKTAIFVYFTGQGLIDDRSLIVLNDKSNSPTNAFAFPLERMLRTMSENKSLYIIALFDCYRRTMPKRYRNLVNDIEDESEEARNLILIFGCQPGKGLDYKQPLAKQFIDVCENGKKKQGGQVNFPMDFLSFKTGKEQVTDTTHAIKFPKHIQKSETMVDGNIQFIDSETTQGTLTTETCTYNGDLVKGTELIAQGEGTLEFTKGPKEGDTYTGQFIANRFNGNGVYNYNQKRKDETRLKYEGGFVDGTPCGRGKLTLSNKNSIEGDFKDGVCHGQGKCRQSNRDVYEGEFKNNLYHGKGKMIYQDSVKSYYEGNWIDGYQTGKGKRVFSSGKEYTGDFVCGKFDGHGECKFNDGSVYVGQWKVNAQFGQGTLTCGTSGDVFTGEFHDNKRVSGHTKCTDGGETWANYQDDNITGHYKRLYPNGTLLEGPIDKNKLNGQGKYTFTSGIIYEGNFVDDLLQGDGYKITKDGVRRKVVFKDNTIEKEGAIVTSKIGRLETSTCWYEGEIVDGYAHGDGVLFYTSGEFEGDRYEGQMSKNQFNGQGKYIFKEGKNQKTYEGQFKDGAMTGQGVMIYKNGDKAVCEFIGGKCNGQGKCYKYNGDLYEGGFKKNFYHGHGKLTWKAGGSYIGDWTDGFATGQGEKIYQSGDIYKGAFIKGKPDGYGKCDYQNGNKYHGDWKANTLDGQGTLYYANGDVYTGTWSNNKRVKGHVKFTDGGEHWANYENEKLVGIYKRKYPNGTILEGLVVNGRINGVGSYTFVSGEKWEGNFVDDLLQGPGFQTKNEVKSAVTFKDNKIDK